MDPALVRVDQCWRRTVFLQRGSVVRGGLCQNAQRVRHDDAMVAVIEV